MYVYIFLLYVDLGSLIFVRIFVYRYAYIDVYVWTARTTHTCIASALRHDHYFLYLLILYFISRGDFVIPDSQPEVKP